MTKEDSAPAFVRLTSFGYLHGTFKDAHGRWMMSVRRDDGSYADVPHDNVCPPKTKDTNRKRK